MNTLLSKLKCILFRGPGISISIVFLTFFFSAQSQDYVYPYIDSLPALAYPIGDLNQRKTFFTEAFFEQGELTLVRSYNKAPTQAGAFLLLSVPFKNNQVDGLLVQLNNDRDTLLKANFLNGLLEGTYYSFSDSHGHISRVYGSYHAGQPVGEKRILREFDATDIFYEDGRRIRTTTTSSDGRMIMQQIWIPEKKQYEYTSWLPNGKVGLKRVLDSNGKELSRQQFYKEEDFPGDPVKP
jgi:hypothetical protein